jgi:thiol-disulfide isomerase/thioredoxin
MKIIRFLLLITVLFTGFTGELIAYAETDQVSDGIVKGLEAPEFEIKLVNSEETLTKKKLLGKVYLLDFWMTRCRKCVDKMPFLHDIHEKYRDKNLEIISISSDSSFETVEEFRRGHWKMPWLHCLGVEGNNRQVMTVFKVNKLPKLILIDREGKIVCTNYETDDAGFEKILEEIFK